MKDVIEKIKSKLLPESSLHRSLLFIFALIFFSIIATAYFFDKDAKSVKAVSPELALRRDYYHSPLNMSDAYQYCLAEAKKQLGPALQRYAMDTISTRYNEKDEVFFIVLKVDVGSISDYREASVYCNVDPKKYQVSYYKEVYPGEDRSILSRTIDFFSNL